MANKMNSLNVFRLTPDYTFKSFDCGNEDLNNFILEDAQPYAKRLLAVTYIIEVDGEMAGFFSVSNDKIAIPDSDKATWRRIKKLFPHSKHRSDYPTVKIGRLAIDVKHQHSHYGRYILNFVKSMFVSNNRTGCAFVTVDALKEALPFYLKNGFELLRKEDANEDHVTYLLYYDLTQLLD